MDEKPHTPKKPWTIEKTAALLVIIVIVFFALNALSNETDKLSTDVDESEQFVKCYENPQIPGCDLFLRCSDDPSTPGDDADAPGCESFREKYR